MLYVYVLRHHRKDKTRSSSHILPLPSLPQLPCVLGVTKLVRLTLLQMRLLEQNRIVCSHLVLFGTMIFKGLTFPRNHRSFIFHRKLEKPYFKVRALP